MLFLWLPLETWYATRWGGCGILDGGLAWLAGWHCHAPQQAKLATARDGITWAIKPWLLRSAPLNGGAPGGYAAAPRVRRPTHPSPPAGRAGAMPWYLAAQDTLAWRSADGLPCAQSLPSLAQRVSNNRMT